MTRTTGLWTTAAGLLVAALAACGGSASDEGEKADGRRTVTVPAGTEVVVQLDEQLSTRSHKKGDSFTARVATAVTVRDRTVLPPGAVVHGTVTGVQQAGDNRQGVLKIDFSSVEVRGQSADLTARVVETHPEQRSTSSTGEDAAKVGGAAAAGAILGRVIGGNGTGAAVGAAVGAAAGTGIVLATKNGYAVLPKGSNLRLALTEPLTVPVPRDESPEERGTS